MNVALFYHSLVSDWNHGNAHFLRGIAAELLARGHAVTVFEPEDAWSRRQLEADHGLEPIRRFARRFPHLQSVRYAPATFDVEPVLREVDLVLVHEWSDPAVVARIGAHRERCGRCRVLFHDTHHRLVTDRESMAAYDLRHYDGVLAFGRVLRDLYAAAGWTRRAFVWHEAADTRVFHPRARSTRDGDLVFVGNWGDGERAAELHEFLVEPVRRLGLRARVHGVRYPPEAHGALAAAGIEHGGFVPNYEVPEVFARFDVTIHVPRGPYARALPGIPTIRPFEALACGIPLVSAPWHDAEGLFTPGRDYLVARDGDEMVRHLSALRAAPDLAAGLAAHGLATINRRHTCTHRVDELLAIDEGLRGAFQEHIA
jgi:spore maturation protein CgeB